MKFDLVSDLHIDYWDENTDWIARKNSDLLVVAGDICDDQDLAIEYIKMLGNIYDTVLWVDGNHEHEKSNKYPIESCRDYHRKINHSGFLPIKSSIIENTAFIGACGWWNYCFAEPVLSKEYIKEQFGERVNKQVVDEFELLVEQDKAWIVKELETTQAESVVLITHTLPHRLLFCEDEHIRNDWYRGMFGNTLMETVNDPRIKYWCYGHSHHQSHKTINGVDYVCNPRGRPKTNHYADYAPTTLEI